MDTSKDQATITEAGNFDPRSVAHGVAEVTGEMMMVAASLRRMARFYADRGNDLSAKEYGLRAQGVTLGVVYAIAETTGEPIESVAAFVGHEGRLFDQAPMVNVPDEAIIEAQTNVIMRDLGGFEDLVS